MVQTQITRIRNFDGSQTLRKHSDGSTLPYSGPNLTTMLSGVTDPVFVLKRIDNNGNPYPFTLRARNQTEYNCRLCNCMEFVAIKSRPCFYVLVTG
ncbi:MAG: hypothetical protein WBM37_04215 [Nitrososphaeraceae archaeon]